MRSDKIIQIKPLGFPWETLDPFLFCAYHRDIYPKGDTQLGVSSELLKGRNMGQDFTLKNGFRMYHGNHIPGFPYHPHRGFETITINKEGTVDHTDSLGAAGRFGAGDVQWMTAGKGIQHSEMFPLIYENKKNPLEIFQIWLNLPKRSKFVEPHFKMLWKHMVPLIKEKDKNGKLVEIDLIAGKYAHKIASNPTPDSWASNPANSVCVLTIKLNANANWKLSATSDDVNRTLYYYKGKGIEIEGVSIGSDHFIQLIPNMEIKIQNGNEESRLLLLQGKPIQEPVVKYGPFVMNSEIEIKEAFADYKKTQFGGWPWPNIEQIHGRSNGRFANHADGKKEIL